MNLGFPPINSLSILHKEVLILLFCYTFYNVLYTILLPLYKKWKLLNNLIWLIENLSKPKITDLTDLFCRCQNDPTLGFFPLNSTSFGYRYQTFKFVNFDQVFLHCKAFVCLVSEKSAECDRSCNSTTNTTPAPSGRRRREAIVRTSYTKPIYHIQSPPLSFSRRNGDNSIIRQWNITTSTATLSFKYEDY